MAIRAQLVEIKIRCQQILAAEIDDGLMLGSALGVAISLNDAHAFVLDPCRSQIRTIDPLKPKI